jgi:hypothetical protein
VGAAQPHRVNGRHGRQVVPRCTDDVEPQAMVRLEAVDDRPELHAVAALPSHDRMQRKFRRC